MTEVGIIIKTSEDGSLKVKKLGGEFKKTGDVAEQSARKITNAWEETKKKMIELSNQVLALQQEIGNIRANVLVTLDDHASQEIEAIQDSLDKLHDKTITVTTLHKDIYGESNQGYTGYGGELHSGTPFVPHTGMYFLERGEAVIPASQNDHRHYDNRQINNFTFNQPTPNSFDQEQRFSRLVTKKITI